MELIEVVERFGLPLALIIGLALGRFVPGFIYAERRNELAAMVDEVKRLNEKIIDDVVPAMAHMTTVVQDAMRLLAEMQMEQHMRDKGR